MFSGSQKITQNGKSKIKKNLQKETNSVYASQTNNEKTLHYYTKNVTFTRQRAILMLTTFIHMPPKHYLNVDWNVVMEILKTNSSLHVKLSCSILLPWKSNNFSNVHLVKKIELVIWRQQRLIKNNDRNNIFRYFVYLFIYHFVFGKDKGPLNVAWSNFKLWFM